MLLKIATLISLLCLVSGYPFQTGYKYQYSYEGQLITGTKEPVEYISYTLIKSQIIVIPNQDTLWMKIGDVTYTTYSGSSSEDNAKAVPLVEGSNAIKKPFKFGRYGNSSIPGIFVSPSDEPWSMNMKQAIANLFYLDERVFKADEPESFTDKSDGFKKFNYFVLPNNNNNRLKVIKLKSNDYYKHTDKGGIYNEKHPILPGSKRQTYDLEGKDGKFTMNNIISVSNIDYHPFQGNGTKVYVLVNQTLHLKEKSPFKHCKFAEPIMEYREISLDSNAYLPESGVYDVFAGRNTVDMNLLALEVKTFLEELEYSMNTTQITLDKSEMNYALNILIFRLRRLCKQCIMQLGEKLTNLPVPRRLLELLLKVLALTGTPSSYSAIVDIILRKAFDEELTVLLLESMSNNVVKFPKDLQDQFIKLTNDNIPEKIRRQSILTIASMISISMNRFGNVKHFDEFIDHILEKLKESKDEKESLLYVNALRSIKSPKSDLVLRKIVKNVRTTYLDITPHIRATAMLGLRHSHERSQILILIVTNTYEHFEVRATALRMLMDPEHPENLEKTFWTVYNDDDNDLKQLLYQILVSMAQSAIPRYEVSRVIANKLLPYVEDLKLDALPNINVMLDFLDESFFFESMAQLTLYGKKEHGFTMLHVQLSSQTAGPTWSKYEYYVYFDWKSNAAERILFFIDVPKNVEWTSVKNGRVISMDRSLSRNELLNVDINENTEVVLRTDMGVPVIFYDRLSSIRTVESKNDFSSQFDKKLVFNMICQSNEVYGFLSYNPASNTWVGVSRIQSTKVIVPVDLKFESNLAKKSIKFAYKVPENSFGFESYVYSEVLLRDYDRGNTIKASCPDCKFRNVVTNGEDELENFVFLEENNENATLQYKLAVFDCENHLTASYPAELLDIFMEENMNYESARFLRPLIGAYHLWKYMSMSPRLARCGFGLKIEPSKTNPAAIVEVILSSFDSNSRFKLNHLYDINTYSVKKSLTFTYQVLKSTAEGYEVMNKLDFISSIIGSRGKSLYFNVYSSWDKTNVPRFNFCLEELDKWLHNAISGTLSLSLSKDPQMETKDECPKDGFSVDIKKLGEMSEEQKKNNEWGKAFHVCDDDFSDCIRTVSSYRFYKYEINYANVDKDQAAFWMKIFDFVRLVYGREFVRMPYPERKKLNPGQMIVTVTYPLYYDSINVTVVTEKDAFRFDNIAIEDWLYIPYVNPQSSFILDGDIEESNLYCEVGIDYIRSVENGNKSRLEMPKVDYWKDIAIGTGEFSTWKIKAKKDKFDNLVLYLSVGKEVIEVSYGEDFEIRINGKPVPLESKIRYRQTEWIDYMVVPEYKNNKRIILHIRHISVNVEYDKNVIKMSLPKYSFNGACRINRNTSRKVKWHQMFIKSIF